MKYNNYTTSHFVKFIDMSQRIVPVFQYVAHA